MALEADESEEMKAPGVDNIICSALCDDKTYSGMANLELWYSIEAILGSRARRAKVLMSRRQPARLWRQSNYRHNYQ